MEGLKRARAPSESDEKFEDLAYDLAETQVKLEETQTKLDDMTEVLGGLFDMLLLTIVCR